MCLEDLWGKNDDIYSTKYSNIIISNDLVLLDKYSCHKTAKFIETQGKMKKLKCI
jgi:hypothetical protein